MDLHSGCRNLRGGFCHNSHTGDVHDANFSTHRSNCSRNSYQKKPSLAEKIVKYLRPITYIIVLLLIAVGIYVNLSVVRLLAQAPWQLVVASAALPAVAMALCVLVSCLMRQQWKQIKTICIEVAVQNTAIPLLILKGTMEQPDADLSSVPSILVVTIVNLYLITGMIIHLINKKCCKKTQSTENDSPSNEKDQVNKISSKTGTAWSNGSTPTTEAQGKVNPALDITSEMSIAEPIQTKV